MRISLDTQASGSITKQRERIARFAGNDIEWYEERSVSGSKIAFKDRPQGGLLLAALEQGDRVLVTKIDRAARSVKDLLATVEDIRKAGASIVFVDQNIDTSGPMGQFLLVLLAAIAELEAAIIGERRRESLESFVAQGRHAVGAAPFGFQAVPNPNGRGLVIRVHPTDGPVLKDAIGRWLKGESQDDIARSIGMTAPGFNRLMHNPRLAGMTPTKGGVVMIDGVPRIDPDAALLTMTELSRLKAKQQASTGWNRNEGIGAALQCGTCGDRLYYATPAKDRTSGNYRCRKSNPIYRGRERVRSAGIRSVDAEEYVERAFLDRFGDTMGVVTYWEDSADARTEAVSIAKVRLEEVRRLQDEAVTDEEEDALAGAYREAKRALRDAERLPTTRRMVTEPTGRTIGEEWRDASPASRVAMLKVAGEWTVQPGRLPIEEKIILKERSIDMEVIKAGLTPLS